MRLRLLRAASAGLVLLLGLLAAPEDARANGRFPTANQLVFSPTDPSFLFLRATFGALVSSDAGKTWGWTCEQAMVGDNSVIDPSVGITENGTVVLAANEGFATSPDRGCSWSLTAGTFASLTDLVVRPDDPHTVLALLSKYAGVGDAGIYFDSQVYASSADGANLAPQGSKVDPSYEVLTLEVAKTDPNRLYLSGYVDAGAAGHASVFVSKDMGATFVTYALPYDPVNEQGAYVAGVDPTNADRVYVRTAARNTPGTLSRLFVSDDGGQTFTLAFAGTDLRGFAQSDDGSTIYVGGPTDGLHVASRTDMTFHPVANRIVQCLAYRAGTLYLCSNDESTDAGVGGFALGTSTDDGATFTPLLHLPCVPGPLTCGASTTTATTCDDLWPAQAPALGQGSADAGALCGTGTDAGADAGSAHPAAPASKGCGGCASAPSGGSAGFAAGSLLMLALLGLRARRKKA